MGKTHASAAALQPGVLFDVHTPHAGQDQPAVDAMERALRQVVGILWECADTADVVVPWRGNQYLVALPRAEARVARDYAERVQRALRRAGDPAKLLAGVAELGDGEDFHLALARAAIEVKRLKEPAQRRPVGPIA